MVEIISKICLKVVNRYEVGIHVEDILEYVVQHTAVLHGFTRP